MENMISVVVITYNQEATIGRTLDSILMQQCHIPIEIVIGEDCSTDGTRAVCQRYAEQHPGTIRLLANKQNKGVLTNYLACVLAARGTYIADCAGDDFWIDPLKLEKELCLMERDASITLVHTAWQTYHEHSHNVSAAPCQPFSAPVTDGSDMLEAIITQTRMPVIHLCTSLYRADVIRQAYHAHPDLFQNTQWPCEDLQIAFMMAFHGKIGYLPDVTLNYSQGHPSVSSPHTIKRQFDFYQRATQLSHHLATTYQLHSALTQRFFNQRAFSMLMFAFRAHSRELRRTAIACQNQWGATTTLAIALVKGMTACEPLWQGALVVRQVFVTIKRLFR